MSAVLPPLSQPAQVIRTRADRLLPRAMAAWLGTALLGQLFFVIYVLGFYGRHAMNGRPDLWNKVLPSGWEPGQVWGNAVLAGHLLFTVVILLGGALQLWPWLRRSAPALHRWNGRLYLLSAAIMSLGGLQMVWTRQGVGIGDLGQHLGISLNALLILVFAWLGWRSARERRIDDHKRWMLRLFLVVSGVWFFRVGLMFWLVVNQGPVGFDPETFTGPFLTALSFGQTLLPLALLQLVLKAQASPHQGFKRAAAAGLGLVTLAMLIGIAMAAAFMWWPRLH
ncbi:DUF2306 domain-containing protein [Paucibacter sp. APW11]|uniref:DUF2306 domain-containing protein n=1 Tax=Roseateles aquae TaxID=3077235 RepID=A0ABU3PBP3_9BURK|nr:DUF2306 domain-containing protein [Paucibacter sp. APW11]MDT8999981.1 DUF2306 domain-containing protein [Paucibacter sp. APW11]